jgi:hypothetical protein
LYHLPRLTVSNSGTVE